jgi:hypothetical protein
MSVNCLPAEYMWTARRQAPVARMRAFHTSVNSHRQEKRSTPHVSPVQSTVQSIISIVARYDFVTLMTLIAWYECHVIDQLSVLALRSVATLPAIRGQGLFDRIRISWQTQPVSFTRSFTRPR